MIFKKWRQLSQRFFKHHVWTVTTHHMIINKSSLTLNMAKQFLLLHMDLLRNLATHTCTHGPRSTSASNATTSWNKVAPRKQRTNRTRIFPQALAQDEVPPLPFGSGTGISRQAKSQAALPARVKRCPENIWLPSVPLAPLHDGCPTGFASHDQPPIAEPKIDQ